MTTATPAPAEPTTWEAVIGLEVHLELATATKLFCSCANEFGSEPNTNVCPVCLGLPGSLPVLNARAVEFALRVGEALDFEVPERSEFARKNYFYPDMPKDYQISQYESPVCEHGSIEVDGTRIGITRAHLEEDTGKTLHVGGGGGRIHGAAHSLVDYNRAGIPLLEIVSEPDLGSAEQARRYVEELRATLKAIGVSDVKMEEGSLRVDANVSVRPAGSDVLGTKVEVKNMNSLRSLGRAVAHEIERQVAALEAGEPLVQETRHWSEDDGRTRSMRSKEESHDYRYFPEPDLVPLAPTAEQRAAVRGTLPELPAARRARLVAEWGVAETDVRTLQGVDGLLDYAEAAVAAGGTPRDVVIWASGDLLAHVNESGAAVADLRLGPEGLAELFGLLAAGTISRRQAKEVLGATLAGEGGPAEVVAARGLEQVSDEGAVAAIVDAVLAAEAAAVSDYRSGDDKVRKKKRGFLMGEVMKALRGQGDPQTVNRVLDTRLTD